MHNFGRGMWRRLGDFERIQSPQILKQMQLEQYIYYIENLQRQARINAYRENILKNVNSHVEEKPVIIAKEEQEQEKQEQEKQEQEKQEQEKQEYIIVGVIDIPNIEETPIYKEPILTEDKILLKPKALKKGHKKRK